MKPGWEWIDEFKIKLGDIIVPQKRASLDPEDDHSIDFMRWEEDDPNRIHIPEDAEDLKPGAKYRREDLDEIFDLHDGLWGCDKESPNAKPKGEWDPNRRPHELNPDINCPDCVQSMEGQHESMGHGIEVALGEDGNIKYRPAAPDPTFGGGGFYPDRCPGCKRDLEGFSREGQVIPQQPGDHRGDNGIVGPIEESLAERLDDAAKIIPGTQMAQPTNNDWNVSIDNRRKTGARSEDLINHIFRNHAWSELGQELVKLLQEDPEALPQVELDALHVEDHAMEVRDHNPETLRVAKDESA